MVARYRTRLGSFAGQHSKILTSALNSAQFLGFSGASPHQRSRSIPAFPALPALFRVDLANRKHYLALIGCPGASLPNCLDEWTRLLTPSGSRMRFSDRSQAGQLVAQELREYTNNPDVVVLALPRGGVPVGFEVACALNAPLDIIVVRKLGVPDREELAMGAIASGDVRVLNQDIIDWLQIPPAVIDRVTELETMELHRREQAYRSAIPPLEIAGKIVILVDDGIATGSTMRAAVKVVRSGNPERVVIAVPTAPPSTIKELRSVADDFVSVISSDAFVGVGQWYEDFRQVSDEVTRDLYERARLRHG
jgi:putative phosphoribosyl transferase